MRKKCVVLPENKSRKGDVYRMCVRVASRVPGQFAATQDDAPKAHVRRT